ncbi:hypothetical protein KQI21_12190 [Virgibacillus proomii]|nr:hypothetical protein [Virgibacillus proomii]
MFDHIKGNRSFYRFSFRGLDKAISSLAIVTLAHNLVKVAGLRLATFIKNFHFRKTWLVVKSLWRKL